MNKFKSLLGGVALSVAIATSSLAAGVELNASSTGLALQGYDPVAYFTEGEATKGNWKITATHNDATYRFASEENKAAFEANPDAYLPAYGGYCAFGAAMGFKFDGDPNYWRIVDDRLYLNLSEDIQERWEGDIPGFIEKASANWNEIADKDPAELQQQ
ncbi:YHS domain-containing protein [Ruegeria sediminis]|uniref:YHS domain-containing protein n=1 Tax=Ruegeria sediminis TaxID=2583820 RepID=A0ABY2X5B0_9RHOB|nr:YHS domain-containing (seleno)protein [Ruegeria sediminis]TMV10288.1 YHS domain-containing protein [Ruegeria sediminis]